MPGMPVPLPSRKCSPVKAVERFISALSNAAGELITIVQNALPDTPQGERATADLDALDRLMHWSYPRIAVRVSTLVFAHLPPPNRLVEQALQEALRAGDITSVEEADALLLHAIGGHIW